MAWESQEAMAQAQPPEAPAQGGWESDAKAAEPAKQASGWESEAKPTTEPVKAEKPMPGTLEALWQGVGSGTGDVGQSLTALSSVAPQPVNEESPAAGSLGWESLTQPINRGLPQVAYRLGKSYPTLAAGVAGGVGGTALGTATAGPVGGVVGGLAGGTLGAAAGSAFQTIGPVFAQELKNTPNDPDGAWDRALRHAAISGAFSGASWAAFPVRFFQGPVKQLAFQALGVQPGIAMAEKATQNVTSGKPATEGLGEAYVEGAVGTAVPAAGHLALTKPAVVPPKIGPPEKGSYTAEFWKRNFQPELVSDKALQADPQFARYKSATAQERDAIMNRAEEHYYEWNKVPDPQKLEFIKSFETGSHVPANLIIDYPWMQERANAYRSMLKQAHADEAAYGSKAGYIEDYFPHIWADPVQAAKTFEQMSLPQNLGPKWFQKERYYDLIEDGLNSGLKLKSTNPEELVTMRLMSGADMRQRMELLHRLQDMGLAVPAATAPKALSSPSWREASPWQKINAPNKEAWMIAPDIQPLWQNAVEAKGLWANQGAVGTAFRGWMNLKNAWVPIKLALSAFHPLHVAHINLSTNVTRALNETLGRGQQSTGRRIAALPQAAAQSVIDMALALPVGTPFKGKVAREAWLTPKEKQTPDQRYTTQLFNEGGFSPQLSEQLRIAAKRGFSDALHNGQYLKALPHALRRSIEVVQKPIFEQWIPNLKAAAYLREAEALFRKKPNLLSDPINRGVALRAIGKQVDNRFGEMFYGGLFWNRTMKDASIGSFLSLGWNLGFAREFIGGALEPVARKFAASPTPTRQLIRETTSKSTNAFIYTMTAFAINAMMNKAMTGENPEGYDYIFPRIGGNNPDGSPRRITNMFYTREVPMAKKNIEERDSIVGGLSQMLYHKLMFAPVVEGMTNKDYFGYQMYDPNAPGFKQAYQLGKNILTEQLNPMSVSGAKRAMELSGKPHTGMDVLKGALTGDQDVIMPFLGFGPAPAYASKTPIQNRIGFLYREHVAPVSKPFEQKEIMEKRREARTKLDLARQNKDATKITEAMKELVATGVKAANATKVQPGTGDVYMFSRLPVQDQAIILKGSSKDEFKRYYQKSKLDTKKLPEIRAMWGMYYAQ